MTSQNLLNLQKLIIFEVMSGKEITVIKETYNESKTMSI